MLCHHDVHLDAVGVTRKSPAPCSGALLLSLGGTPVPPAAPQTPVLAVPQSRGQEGLGCTIDVAFVFLFKLAEAGLAGRLSVRCPGMHCASNLTPTPELRCTPPCPLRGTGKSLLFLFYNITWFCKCCFLFQYLYFLLLKVKKKNLRCKNFAIPQNIVKNKKPQKSSK